MRTSANATSHPGQAFVMKTIIKIHWGWLALPIALTALTGVLLILTIIDTRRRNVVSWKSSGLALLFHRLEGWDITHETFRSSGGLEDVAKGMKGRLMEVDDGFAFVKEKRA